MMFWFDDGVVEDYTKTLPYLKKLGHTGIFAIVTEWVGKPGFMNIEQIKELIKAGHKIAPHGTNHKLMHKMEDAEAEKVLSDSRHWIVKNLGVMPFAFVAPCNILKREQWEIALQYYGQVRHPLFLHFHSKRFEDILRTIPKYIKGPCPNRGNIRRRRYDASKVYLMRKYGVGFEGV